MNEYDEERKTKAEEKRIRDIVREEIRNAQLALETPVKKEPDCIPKKELLKWIDAEDATLPFNEACLDTKYTLNKLRDFVGEYRVKKED